MVHILSELGLIVLCSVLPFALLAMAAAWIGGVRQLFSE